MTNTAHSTLTGANLHEPKGVATATSGQVYIADGAGSGAWATQAVAGRWALIATNTPTNVASSTFTGFDSAIYKDYKFILDHVAPSTDGGNMCVQVSTNSGSSYDTGSNYRSSGNGISGGGFTGENTTAGFISLNATNTVGNSTNEFISGEVTVYTPGTSQWTAVNWQVTIVGISTNLINITGGGLHASVSIVNGLRFLFDNGNIALGTIRMYGLVL